MIRRSVSARRTPRFYRGYCDSRKDTPTDITFTRCPVAVTLAELAQSDLVPPQNASQRGLDVRSRQRVAVGFPNQSLSIFFWHVGLSSPNAMMGPNDMMGAEGAVKSGRIISRTLSELVLTR